MLDNDQAHGFLQRQEILLSELLVGAQAIWKKAQLIGVTDPKWQCYFENLWSNQPNTCEYPNPALFKSKKSSYLLVHLQFMLAEFSLPVTATHFPTVWVWFRFVDSLVGRYTNKSPLKSWSHLVTQNMLLKSPLWLKSTSKPHHFTLHHVKMDGFYIFCSACWILFLVETTPSKWWINNFFLAKTSPSHGVFLVRTAAPKITRPYRPPEQRSTHPVPPVRYLHLGSSTAGSLKEILTLGLGILGMWYYTYHLCIQVCIDIIYIYIYM